MKSLTVAVALALVTVSCGNETTDVATPHAPEMMARALVELVTKDHTFGTGPSPFSEYLVLDHVDPAAGDTSGGSGGSTRALTDAERAAIVAALSPLGSVRWIDDPAEWRTGDLQPAVEGAAIVGVGEPVIMGSTGLVPVSLWCGGLCGTWFTYRLDLVDNEWVVIGPEGPVAIS
ncbi:MAG: hypothetical protein R2823_01440 [Acidimicrobiia bacterium]